MFADGLGRVLRAHGGSDVALVHGWQARDQNAGVDNDRRHFGPSKSPPSGILEAAVPRDLLYPVGDMDRVITHDVAEYVQCAGRIVGQRALQDQGRRDAAQFADAAHRRQQRPGILFQSVIEQIAREDDHVRLVLTQPLHREPHAAVRFLQILLAVVDVRKLRNEHQNSPPARTLAT